MGKIREPNKKELRIIKLMIFFGIISIIHFVLYFFQPQYRGNIPLYILLTITILYGAFKKFYMWYNYSNISIPKEREIVTDFKVDILTTYFPGEPYQMIITTLEAILNISYPHETYLCDEANDPYLKEFCREHGIHHVTRNNRVNAKAGNINNALNTVAKGDICVVLDPDHIPHTDFLYPVLPHFEDPDIGFVQVVQSYYNIKESLVARGAAEQTFQFYGPIMMTLNAYKSVNAIGANCVFRRKALNSIGGHAPGLCEDMHTAMLLYSKNWRAVYVPQVLAQGLAPSNLTNFFKQQLKWARGSFDLLRKVYPKIFKRLTTRQKIHFGILPLHYLGGLICLFTFLIPILSLLFSVTPWKGNIVDFFIMILPVVVSSILIRVYIQKWVIEKKERGFHIIGGLLYINTWWIYIVGLLYTVLDKDVPYLPTPKEDEWNTNLKIVIPNATIAILSLFSIIYGLQKDLTPFSIIMAGFAFFNFCIMFFGIYLTIRISKLRNKKILLLEKMSGIYKLLREKFYILANLLFFLSRKIALPILLIVLLISMTVKHNKDNKKWKNMEISYVDKEHDRYLGIFHPTSDSGVSDLDTIVNIENQTNTNFDIISFYLAWGDKSYSDFPGDLVNSIYGMNAIPMITWEPWTSDFQESEEISALERNQKVFKYIAAGYFDDYIKQFGVKLAAFERPVFLRFAHEFDNPQYPWSAKGGNTPKEFIVAWRHVHDLLKSVNAHQVMMVWNPWRSQLLQKYYPGDDYVDWIGITALDYGKLNSTKQSYSFNQLYQPFHSEIGAFTNKPVMLAEFGSLKINKNQKKWSLDAIETINSTYPEISAIVLFNSSYDKNIPLNNWYDKKQLDWTTSSLASIDQRFKRNPLALKSSYSDASNTFPNTKSINPLTNYDIRGVRYKKGYTWEENFYAATRETIRKDFELLKEAGFNTIQFRGGNVYNHNLLTYAGEYGLNVIYEFKVDNTLNFIVDKDQLKDLKEEIIAQVHQFKENNTIIGFTFRDDLDTFYGKPLLFYQRSAYYDWLSTLAQEIKLIDPEKSLNIDMAWSKTAAYNIRELYIQSPFDSFGIRISDSTGMSNYQTFAQQNQTPVYISSVTPEVLSQFPIALKNYNFILQNYQNERQSDYITFDGIVDFDGNKKRTLEELEKHWKSNEVVDSDIIVRILRPSEPLLANQSSVFHPVLFKNDQWTYPSEMNSNYNFKWHLIKNDRYGNPIAINQIGKEATLELEIPENYKEYELLLTLYDTEKRYSLSSRSQLHTPSPD
ncbi:glycosyltransferase family 2 protein [Zunongwangia sp. F260]|uniref:Glycosyltransferase family 2 protein n=1 Tax=Autumnicola lenta TaxID=3075593 RepID=A0ABU3CIM7_9FLAO|nr:glycosyltransferase family 2 protein [Zunongwangia sp. F260]MDT0646208.1 glycosyltransferase family 2 protein [Zunongwangia sp. F260]